MGDAGVVAQPGERKAVKPVEILIEELPEGAFIAL